ncbi:restriction endonuclease [Metasolibacillus sp. FSL H7-0170]|uniref:restriction endonuclease n=1 Tax=Metasolibacillus TaxID=2703677 RepID=UPI000797C1C8|nr:restriction endonuclease [Metasolibacillus fluoroglycofenilyticus]KYG89178.1 endonuclease [[Bacillus] sp. KCTC 13219]
MKKRKKKHKKSLFTSFLQILLVISGVIGWYFTKTWQGIITAIVIYFVVIICCTVWFKTRRLARLRRAGIKDVDNMTGEEFEQFLGQLFKRRGYKVSYTAASGDYGADLILKDRKEIIAVQAKRYSGTVGVKAVQEIIGAVKMYDATEAWVVTNSHFTKQAIKLADINDVYLIDREELIDLILKK